ncbi:MAG: 4a-hydroxytetrahydrobiopterin dehydratase [Aridibacter sp.]|jgi:4a-hydroxytetrahydrobiopterin dehydratase|nr:4a-hydroxytetrahydrobiopterin dehydratase [Acidobacteriota bacterium]
MSRIKLSADEIKERLKKLNNWKVEGKFLRKKYKFENFAESLAFVNKVGEIAEERDHHPDITFGWGYAEFEITTHDTGGLTHNDFELAEAIENI